MKVRYSGPTLRRLPRYYQYLLEELHNGTEIVSAKVLSERLDVETTLVRKDLAVTGINGRPKVGYRVADLVEALENCLGLNLKHRAVLVGVGNLGRALIGHEGFRDYGLEIVSLFDSDPATIGRSVGGVQVLNAESLVDWLKENPVDVGIITVPRSSAQKVASKMVAGGIGAIWNFAPRHLSVPDYVKVEYVNLAASFSVLAFKLTQSPSG